MSAAVVDEAAVAVAAGPQTGGRRVLARLIRQPATLIGLGYLVVLATVAALAPAIAPYDPLEQDLTAALQGPSADHLLGTDHLGRDTLSRLVFGARVALQASLQAVGLALLIGVPLGLFVAYRSGWWDRIGMRFLDVADAIPGLVLAFAVIAVLGRGLTNAMLAVGIIFAMSYMRLTRAIVLGEREKLYVDSARVSGLRDSNIMFRQVLPNIAGPLIVQTTIYLGTALLIEAALSFLGLGLDVIEASWGGMLNSATEWQVQQPFLPWPPGLAITLTVLAFNIVGDGLRDALSGEQSIRGRRARKQQATLRAAAAATPRPPANGRPPVLAVERLSVQFPSPDGPLTVVDDVSLALHAGETLGLVGESGSGKSMTGLAAIGLLPVPGFVAGGSIRLAGTELVTLGDRALGRIRGDEIGMVFQDPLVALSPVHTVGRQLTQSLRNHLDLSRTAARDRAAELLGVVGVPDPRARLDDYPHQFSGGMAQRVVIAMALACEPKVLIADEPTTALDVTIQRQVLDLLADLKERFGMAVLLITHDFGVVAAACDRAAVMYAGQIVEQGGVDDLFGAPRHPYTRALLAAMPRNGEQGGRLPTIEGRVPAPWALPAGCRFQPRCPYAQDACGAAPVPLSGDVRCVRAAELTHAQAAS